MRKAKLVGPSPPWALDTIVTPESWRQNVTTARSSRLGLQRPQVILDGASQQIEMGLVFGSLGRELELAQLQSALHGLNRQDEAQGRRQLASNANAR